MTRLVDNERFALGAVVGTPAALDALARAGITPQQLLRRHARGDWGVIGAEDACLNEDALHTGARLLSAYPVGTGRVWIITEADRSVTTLLLPEEY
ncbi:hypothetical protein SAMN04488038_10786 [Solimonas aquatica]|uniref:Type I restriction endonuclease subunit M n=1 Tax=Solimonas aquatica TaxID=489703 RepID=A0A1H9GIC9_9GAMM|nr:hypothetical protein [Solimonas aquatica]SEQ49845.1 hypothetical protein SAMN04488038_10786 [Solimonas aquatica]